MKVLQYNLCTQVNHGTEEAPLFEDVLSPVEMTWSEANEEIAKKEAHIGEYTISDDGTPDPVAGETADDVLNALLGVTE